MIANRLNDRSYQIDLAPGQCDSWVWLGMTLPARLQLSMVRLSHLGQASAGAKREVYLWSFPMGHLQYWMGTVHVPPDTARMRLDLIGKAQLPDQIALRLRPISRTAAAALIATRHPLRLLRASFGQRSGLHGRVRAALATMAVGTAPKSYQAWVGLFDTWGSRDHARLLASPRRDAWPSIGACVFNNAPISDRRPQEACLATQESLQQQLMPCACRVVGQGSAAMPLATALAELACDYVALLQAGEVLPEHAVPLLADQAAMLERPAVIYADEDAINQNGVRRDPVFRPEPNHALMLSGTLSRGVWLVRRDVLAAHTSCDTSWAEVLRLRIWLDLYQRGAAGRTYRTPFILTHRRADTATAPPAQLAAVVTQHLSRMTIPARVQAAWPLRVDIVAPPERQPKVSIVVPSACRAPHVARCLAAVLAVTRYREFEVVVAITQVAGLDDVQRATLSQLTGDSRFRYFIIERSSFNYPVANNLAVAGTDGSLVCLLNDDIEPQDPDWLARMVGHLADLRIGVVGARLDYPNGLIQHGGIVMGLAGLCEHVFRFMPGNQAGYAGRAVLDQELSAVTGACLLVRRTLYDAVGGMDERYPSAFNDVDFCLRIREHGSAVVLCATTRLIHYESLSYGRHYSGDDAASREAVDVSRMLARWSDVCVADPFHNPNLALQRGSEWALAFPPRVSKPPDRFEDDTAPI